MLTDKDLERAWATIEPMVKAQGLKSTIGDMEVCSTCHLGPYISLNINTHLMFFLIHQHAAAIEIQYHTKPSLAVIEAAIIIRALMMLHFYPIHAVASKVAKRD